MKHTQGLQQPARGSGFTLIEVMIVLVIMAVLMAIAVPSMRELIARQRVEGIAQELATDLRFLKSQQIQRRRTVGILFASNSTQTCYSLYIVGPAGDDCDCSNTGGSVCPNPTSAGSSVEIKTVSLPASSGVTLSASPDLLRLFGFNAMPMGGTMIQATVQSVLGGTIRISTNSLGAPVLCSVSGNSSSLPACS